MHVVHLMASPFFGGPEKQMLGLARHLPKEVESTFLSFAERGLAQVFIDEVRQHGFQGSLLTHNTPRFLACIREIATELTRLKADVLCTSGYKPDILGWRAARRVGIPIVSVSHGWTAATWKVRCYEALDRWVLRRLDKVISVSHAQAEKVRRAGVPNSKIVVIHNAVAEEAFVERDTSRRNETMRWFRTPPRWIIGAAGRLSPEKGFGVLIDAAARVLKDRPDAGFVLFGDGPLRTDLQRQVAERGIGDRFVFAGFHKDLSRFLPNLDLAVMSSFTEGLPVILLETGAAGVPCVATSVGGIPEVIDDGQTGFLVPAGDAAALAERITQMLDDAPRRQALGEAARLRVRADFSFTGMAMKYYDVFRGLVSTESQIPKACSL